MCLHTCGYENNKELDCDKKQIESEIAQEQAEADVKIADNAVEAEKLPPRSEEPQTSQNPHSIEPSHTASVRAEQPHTNGVHKENGQSTTGSTQPHGSEKKPVINTYANHP